MAIVKEVPGKRPVTYRGKQAKTGNSLGLRFDKALFQSHPEFSGEVRAHVIAPGRMLVVAKPPAKAAPRESDPVLEAFLGFLAADLASAPHQIKTLDRALVKRIHALVHRIPVRPQDQLGDEPLL